MLSYIPLATQHYVIYNLLITKLHSRFESSYFTEAKMKDILLECLKYNSLTFYAKVVYDKLDV